MRYDILSSHIELKLKKQKTNKNTASSFEFAASNIVGQIFDRGGSD